MSNATVTIYPSLPAVLAPSRAVAKARLNWVDTARGITMLLVVMGHAHLPDQYQRLFQPFRMPLFYLTAGYLFNWERHRHDLGAYLAARLQRLVLPYFCTAFFFYFVWLLVDYRLLNSNGLSPLKQFVAVFLANGMSEGPADWTIQFDVALWFLGCMATSTIMFVGLLRFFRSDKTYIALILTSLGITALGRVIGTYYPLPWSADVAMMAQFFFVIGFLLRQYGTAFTDVRLLAFFGVVYLVLCWAGNDTDMNRRIYPDFSMFCLGGLAGTYVIYFIARQLGRFAESDPLARALSAPWEFLGRHTMVIMAFHMGGNYLRRLFELEFLGRTYCDATAFWPNFLWMSVASLAAVGVLNSVPALKRIYYK